MHSDTELNANFRYRIIRSRSVAPYRLLTPPRDLRPSDDNTCDHTLTTFSLSEERYTGEHSAVQQRRTVTADHNHKMDTGRLREACKSMLHTMSTKSQAVHPSLLTSKVGPPNYHTQRGETLIESP